MIRTRTDLATLVRLDRQLRALGVRGAEAPDRPPPLACQAVRVATVPSGERGCLVFLDDRLVAVLVRVGPNCAGNGHGVPDQAETGLEEDPELDGWHLESGYGACRVANPPLFGTLSEALAWIARRIHARA